MKRRLHLSMVLVAVIMGAPLAALAGPSEEATGGACHGLPTNPQLQHFLQLAAMGQEISGSLGPNTDAGGLFKGERMWGAVVNRDGRLCAFITSTEDPTQVWPGSQAIAKAKAFTANGFSLDTFVLSTARLYTFALPGHSLFGLNQSNALNPLFLVPPGGQGGLGLIAGGIITFGGGVPLYAGGRIVGGLGVSGDTACADHEIAKRVRDLAGLNPPGGPLVDDIVYEPASIFGHPLCINTVHNGVPLSANEV
nr:heme-binding protein [Candidatus Tectomicrobia bacterium]